jgi:hypothetical protein
MSVEQIVGPTILRPCGGCGCRVNHTQVVSFAASGFRLVELVPWSHFRADGKQCAFKADMRRETWRLAKAAGR